VANPPDHLLVRGVGVDRGRQGAHVPRKPLRQEQVPRRSVEVSDRQGCEWYSGAEVSPKKKRPVGDPLGEWGAWTAARFPNQESRDRFLASMTGDAIDRWEAKPFAHDGREAQVRWRQGHFLGFNDLAVAHHGRIIVTAVPRSER
jgi:hypothetical protein